MSVVVVVVVVAVWCAQVRRTKEMLSANSAAPISVEELHDGKDFQVRARARREGGGGKRRGEGARGAVHQRPAGRR